MNEPEGEKFEFTEEEFREFFGSPRTEPLPPRSRRLHRGVRYLGLFVASALALGGAFTLTDAVITNPDIREPAAIEAAAWSRVAESPFGFLVSDIRVEPIQNGRVGAFVTNNPPDGIITIDFRPWDQDRLDELMDHEMGHLIDFALWESSDPDRKNGLGTEAWAECSAVDAGTRQTDARDPGGEYHCFDQELELYEATLASVGQICARWGDRECRTAESLGLGPDGLPPGGIETE